MGPIKKEIVNTALKTSLAVIPVIGAPALLLYETYENIEAEKEKKRLVDSVKAISVKLKELELNTQIILPELAEELLFDMIKHTKTIYTEFKRDCLANLIKNITMEVNQGTFEHNTYRVIFDQFSKLQDPELELLHSIHTNKNSAIYNENLVTKMKLYEFCNNSEYCIVQLENTGILIKNTGLASSHPDAMYGEYTFTSEAKILATKLFEDSSN